MKTSTPSSTLIWAKQITDAHIAAFHFPTPQAMPSCFKRQSQHIFSFSDWFAALDVEDRALEELPAASCSVPC